MFWICLFSRSTFRFLFWSRRKKWRRVSNARFTLFTNTKPVYYYEVRINQIERVWRLCSIFFSSSLLVFSFNTLSYVCDLIQSSRLLSHYSLYTLMRELNEKKWPKGKKILTKIKCNEKKFRFEFSEPFLFVLSDALCRMQTRNNQHRLERIKGAEQWQRK